MNILQVGLNNWIAMILFDLDLHGRLSKISLRFGHVLLFKAKSAAASVRF